MLTQEKSEPPAQPLPPPLATYTRGGSLHNNSYVGRLVDMMFDNTITVLIVYYFSSMSLFKDA